MPRIKTHPGEILREEYLAPLGMTPNALSMALRVPASRIGEIVNQRRAITADTALRLGRYFGTTPEFWMNLQAGHDVSAAMAERGDQIAADVSPRAA